MNSHWSLDGIRYFHHWWDCKTQSQRKKGGCNSQPWLFESHLHVTRRTNHPILPNSSLASQCVRAVQLPADWGHIMHCSWLALRLYTFTHPIWHSVKIRNPPTLQAGSPMFVNTVIYLFILKLGRDFIKTSCCNMAICNSDFDKHSSTDTFCSSCKWLTCLSTDYNCVWIDPYRTATYSDTALDMLISIAKNIKDTQGLKLMWNVNAID